MHWAIARSFCSKEGSEFCRDFFSWFFWVICSSICCIWALSRLTSASNWLIWTEILFSVFWQEDIRSEANEEIRPENPRFVSWKFFRDDFILSCFRQLYWRPNVRIIFDTPIELGRRPQRSCKQQRKRERKLENHHRSKAKRNRHAHDKFCRAI